MRCSDSSADRGIDDKPRLYLWCHETEIQHHQLVVVLGWIRIPLHQCKSRHIAETTAWRKRRAELDLVLLETILALIVSTAEHSLLQLLRASALDSNSVRAQRIWELRKSGRHLSSGLYNAMRKIWPRPLCALSGFYQKVIPWTGIPIRVILFSPRSLLPGQMHTNAFRSSTDKEWTRFRGRNVSEQLVKWHADVKLSLLISYLNCSHGWRSFNMATVGLFLFRSFPSKRCQLTLIQPMFPHYNLHCSRFALSLEGFVLV